MCVCVGVCVYVVCARARVCVCVCVTGRLQTPDSLRWYRRGGWLACMVQAANKPHMRTGASASEEAATTTHAVTSSSPDDHDASQKHVVGAPLDPVAALLCDRRLVRACGRLMTSGLAGTALSFLSECCEQDSCPRALPWLHGAAQQQGAAADNISSSEPEEDSDWEITVDEDGGEDTDSEPPTDESEFDVELGDIDPSGASTGSDSESEAGSEADSEL
ncbi:MAG: hypothetical protein P4L40_11435 [Terracidiphilus sp.]|nr:hypothetical protein [Terracidiphilus sp.]